MSKEYSQIVTDTEVAKKLLDDILREGGANYEQIKAAYAEAAKNILDGLAEKIGMDDYLALGERFGAETKARAIMAKIPVVADMAKNLPKRGKGKIAKNDPIELNIQRKIDAFWLEIHDRRVAEGKKSVTGSARCLHEKFGIGKNIVSVRTELQHKLKKRRATKRC